MSPGEDWNNDDQFRHQGTVAVDGLIRSLSSIISWGCERRRLFACRGKDVLQGVCSVLDYSVEAKEDESIDAALEKTLKILEFVKRSPCRLFQTSGSDDWLRKAGQLAFTEEEQAEWDHVVHRFERVCAKLKMIRLLIDAEKSWMQHAADALVER